MKQLLPILLATCLVSTANAEPKEYKGTLENMEVTATLNWVDEKNIVGVIAFNDQSGQLTFTGRNTGAGQIQGSLHAGGEQRGTVALKKTLTTDAVVWMGVIENAQVSQGAVLVLKRPR